MQDLLVYGTIVAALIWVGNQVRSFFVKKALSKLDAQNETLKNEEKTIEFMLRLKKDDMANIAKNEEAKTDEEADETLRKNIH